MKIIELKEKTEKELRDMIGVLKEKGRDLRFQLAAGRIKNTREIRSTRKTIAQIQTIMREKKQ
ncbi:50S ribosomal protein L29 [Patescibacteria group bacterium]|nr:50S ribosomal protein L29 [Patescibacteria group bacterium]